MKTEELQVEYSKLCMKSGDLRQRVIIIEREIKMIDKDIRNIQDEFTKLTLTPTEEPHRDENPQETKAP